MIATEFNTSKRLPSEAKAGCLVENKEPVRQPKVYFFEAINTFSSKTLLTLKKVYNGKYINDRTYYSTCNNHSVAFFPLPPNCKDCQVYYG